MKVVLVHRYFSTKVRYDNWVYFGTSYLSQLDCEKKISSKRINISQNVKFFFEKNKKNLSSWIESLRKKNKDDISWWSWHIAGRNNVHSKFFLIICQILAIKKILKSYKDNQNIYIVCENIFLLLLLKDNLKDEKVLIYKKMTLPFFYLCRVINEYSLGLLKQFKLFFRIIYIKILSSFIKTNYKIPKDIILFHHALEKNYSDLTCRYFKNIPNYIDKKKNNVYKIPWFINKKINYSLIKKLKKNKFLILDDFLSFKNYLTIYFNFYKSFKIFNDINSFKNIELNYLFLIEKTQHLREQSVFFLRYAPAIENFSKKINRITSYDHYENMTFEHPLRYALKKINKKNINIGYFHSLVSKNFFHYYHVKTEWDSLVKPDFILCIGKLAKKYLIKNNVPKKKLKIVPAIRQNNFETIGKKKIITVLLPMGHESSVELLNKVYSNREKIFLGIKFKVVIKFHPLSNVKKVLKDCGIKNLPKNWSLSRNEIHNELKRSICSLIMSSASAYDAIIAKSLVININSEFDVYDNYLDVINGASLNKKGDISQINKILKNICIFRKKYYVKKSIKLKKNLLSGLLLKNKTNLDNFIVK